MIVNTVEKITPKGYSQKVLTYVNKTRDKYVKIIDTEGAGRRIIRYKAENILEPKPYKVIDKAFGIEETYKLDESRQNWVSSMGTILTKAQQKLFRWHKN